MKRALRKARGAKQGPPRSKGAVPLWGKARSASVGLLHHDFVLPNHRGPAVAVGLHHGPELRGRAGCGGLHAQLGQALGHLGRLHGLGKGLVHLLDQRRRPALAWGMPVGSESNSTCVCPAIRSGMASAVPL